MRRLLLVLAVLIASCAPAGGIQVLAPDELPRELYGSPDPTAEEDRTLTATIYLVRVDDRDRPLQLVPVPREEETDHEPADFALRELFQGPTQDEVDERLRTAVPDDPPPQLLGLSVEDRVADVNLSAQFESPHAQLIHMLRLAQVVWTLTELPEVDSVRFRIHGVPRPVIDQDGVAHEQVGRGRYSNWAPERAGSLLDPTPEPIP